MDRRYSTRGWRMVGPSRAAGNFAACGDLMRVDARIAPLAPLEPPRMSDSLAANLRLLCSHYRSIAEVCRKLAINRAQFNKYLSGQSRPTPYNLKRICDFFGVEDYELLLPPEQFARLLGTRHPAHHASRRGDALLELLKPLREQTGDLRRYCGYYFEYSNCMSVP